MAQSARLAVAACWQCTPLSALPWNWQLRKDALPLVDKRAPSVFLYMLNSARGGGKRGGQMLIKRKKFKPRE